MKTQSVVLLPLIPSKIGYTRCMSPFSSKRTFEVHAQISRMRIETRRLGTSAAQQVAREGRMIQSDLAKHTEIFSHTCHLRTSGKKKTPESNQSKNDRLLLVNKRLDRFACVSSLSDLTQTKPERLE